MSRLKLGKIVSLARTLPVVPVGPVTPPPAVKLDLTDLIQLQIQDTGADPLPLSLSIASYDHALYANLEFIAVVVVPGATVVPSDPDGLKAFLAAGYPGYGIAAAVPVPVPVPSPVSAFPIVPAVTVPVGALEPIPVATPSPVPSPVAPVGSVLPGSSGGSVAFEVHNVPEGAQKVVIVEQYEV
jgi:hypothetical protein